MSRTSGVHLVVQVNRAALKWDSTTCGEGENYTVLLDVALVDMRPARPPNPEEMGCLNSKGRPSSLDQGSTGTSSATATAGYTKNLELQHACPRIRVKK